MQYVFLFGRTPAISAAEMLAVLRSRQIAHDAIAYGPSWAVVTFLQQPDIAVLQHQVGGVVKIGEVVGSGKDLEGLLSLEQLYAYVPNDSRMTFGVSGYPEEKAFGMRLKKLALARKKELIAQGYSARVVTSTMPALSSAAVQKNKLLTEGAEFMVLTAQGTYVLAVTRTVQDFEGFAARDAKREGLDAKSGMLPLQLARMMVNLSEARPGSTILDPFCGSGTVLTEAQEMRFHVIGSDKSAKAIHDSGKNLETQGEKMQWRLVHSDVLALEKNLPERDIAAIVTEPYLGSPQRGTFTTEGQQHFFEKLRVLYQDAFGVFKNLLAEHGRVVFVFPALATHQGPVLYPFLDDILLQHGFRIVQPLPPEAVKAYRNLLTQRNSLLYGRRGQFVLREIMLLEKGER